MALICLPLLIDIAHVRISRPVDENRALAALPARPRNFAQALRFPTALSAFISDHYGMRNLLVRLDGRLRYGVFSEFLSSDVALGRHDRLFATGNALIDRICGIGYGAERTAGVAAGLAQELTEAIRIVPRTYYISIPTAPIINHDDLPSWLRQRCDVAGAFVPRLQRELARQRPDLADRLIYPKAALDSVISDEAPFPKWFFHWSGIGARAVVESFSEDVLGLRRHVTLHDDFHDEGSDLTPFTPGVKHRDRVPVPDHAAAGIAFCWAGGAGCDPDFFRFGTAISEISRSHWSTGSGPALLIMSDSFGRKAAEYFGEYFADVLHLNIAYERLRPGDLEAIAAQVFRTTKPDVLLFIFHDGGAVFSPFLISTVEAFLRAAH